MSGKSEKTKRYKSNQNEPSKINIRLIFIILLVILLAIYKFLPGGELKNNISKISSNSTDFKEMFSEIASTIKKYTLNDEKITMPVSGKITSEFGKRIDPLTGTESEHLGIDFDAETETEVKAAFSGKVSRCESNDQYGNFVIIEHPQKKISTLYGHLENINVSAGQEINSGEIVGTSGSSGRTTGPHLHFEIRKNNIPVNPKEYMEK